jgi:tRNA threonylcarbamoyladenosine biosynthesis protein TsaB
MIFCIDTSTGYITLALGHENHFLAGTSLLAERAHQARLHPEIKSFLESAHVTLDDVDYFAVVTGPGSFTGLRIGVTAIRGFAWGLKKPVVAISALDCLADNSISSGMDVSPVLDAKRGLIYTARFRSGKGGLLKRVGPERAVAVGQWLKTFRRKTIFLGDAISRYPEYFDQKKNSHVVAAPEALWHIQPIHLWGRAALEVKEKRRVPLQKLEPSYLRLPEAVERLKAKK